MGPLDLFVDHNTNEQRVPCTDGTGLGGREHAAAQAQQDAKGDQHGPECLPQQVQQLSGRCHFIAGALIAVLFGDDVHVDHHEHHAQQAGHIARCKHTSHRDLGGKREHDQAHARRDDGGDQRGSDGNGCAELFIVAALEHFRHKNLCFHGGVCGC